MIVLDSQAVIGKQLQIQGNADMAIVSLYQDSKIVDGIALSSAQMVAVRDYLTSLMGD